MQSEFAGLQCQTSNSKGGGLSSKRFIKTFNELTDSFYNIRIKKVTKTVKQNVMENFIVCPS